MGLWCRLSAEGPPGWRIHRPPCVSQRRAATSVNSSSCARKQRVGARRCGRSPPSLRPHAAIVEPAAGSACGGGTPARGSRAISNLAGLSSRDGPRIRPRLALGGAGSRLQAIRRRHGAAAMDPRLSISERRRRHEDFVSRCNFSSCPSLLSGTTSAESEEWLTGARKRTALWWQAF